MTQTKNSEIVNLKEKLQDAEERYNEARSDQVQLPIYKKKLDDYNLLKERHKALEQDNRQMTRQVESMIQEQKKMEDMQKQIEFYQQEVKTAKTKSSYLQMELDKFGNQFAEKERQIQEQKRLYEMEEAKLRIKETELRETSAKLSVYQRLEDSSRLTSLANDVEPEL